MAATKPTLISVTNDGNGTSFTVSAQSGLGGDYTGLFVVAMGQRDGDIVGATNTGTQGTVVSITVTGCVTGQRYLGYLIQFSTLTDSWFGITLPRFAVADNRIGVFVTTSTAVIRKSIMDAVDSLLRTITTGNGYAQTVAHFHRSRPMSMNRENDYPVLYYWFEGDRSAGVQLNRQWKIVNLIVGGWIFAVDPEDAIEQLMSDVEHVLLSDPSLSGTALDINILDEDMELMGTTVDDSDKRAMSYKTFAILYDHGYADPRAA